MSHNNVCRMSNALLQAVKYLVPSAHTFGGIAFPKAKCLKKQPLDHFHISLVLLIYVHYMKTN